MGKVLHHIFPYGVPVIADRLLEKRITKTTGSDILLKHGLILIIASKNKK